MAIYNTSDDIKNFIKNGTTNDDFYYVDNKKVCRLGFNPTTKGREPKTEFKKAA